MQIFKRWKADIPVNIIPVLLLLFMVRGFSAGAQTDRRVQRLFEDAKQLHSQQNYLPAIEKGLEILRRDSAFVGAYLLLADIYHENQDRGHEIFHLRKAKGYSDMPLIMLRLGNAYYSSGYYEKALNEFLSYTASEKANVALCEEAGRKIESCRFAINAMMNPVEFKPERLPDSINTADDEYWPSLSIDRRQLVFTRLIREEGKQPQEDFFVSESINGEVWLDANPLLKINTPDNEGAQALSADGTILFFTACNRPGGAGSCDIYYSVNRDGIWSTPVNAGTAVNSGYWEAQPSFSSDGQYLYFSSNRAGGKGKRDIWRARCRGFDSSGRLAWDQPVNLGDSINTPGNETSPFIHAGNMDFYFSSDHHTGMGGYDLFLSKIKNDSVFSTPVNLGYPVNTWNDEQGLHIGADGLTAYFSSSRDSLSGLDIYSFQVDMAIRPHPATYAKVFVADAESGEPVRAEIELQNISAPAGSVQLEQTGADGEILICLPAGNNYAFSVSKEGYLFYSDAFDLRDARQIYNPYELFINLMPVKPGAEMNLYNIYFETDSFRILPGSEPELQKLVEFLKVNQGLQVEVQGHTDDTGSEKRNMELSDMRARSVVSYLSDNGIKGDRLQWKGYGEERPVSDNTTEEGRRRNRRTTIKIIHSE